jgi:Protein of unknown function (DUF2442)
MILSIQNAMPKEDYKLQLHFNDGVEKTIDFSPFLNQSQHPSIRAFLQPAKFQSFRIEHGDLVWGDWDLCFPIADLYSGRIGHSADVTQDQWDEQLERDVVAGKLDHLLAKAKADYRAGRTHPL